MSVKLPIILKYEVPLLFDLSKCDWIFGNEKVKHKDLMTTIAMGTEMTFENITLISNLRTLFRVEFFWPKLLSLKALKMSFVKNHEFGF